MKKSVKLLSALLAALLTVSAMPVSAFAAESANSQIETRAIAEDLTWEITEDGVLKITGTGDMPEWTSASKVPWYAERANITAVEIGEGITSVGSHAFREYSKLTSVTIPEGVAKIEKYAFYSVPLTEIELPSTVERIGSYAFAYTKLTVFELPESVKVLDSYAFGGCTSLESAVLPEVMDTIEYSAFSGCSKLARVTMPETLAKMGGSVFSSCTALTSITLPSGVTSWGTNNFADSGLTEVILNEDMTELPGWLFSACRFLTSYTVPEHITSIGEGAFAHCLNLESVELHDGITSIGSQAFLQCTSLTEITLPSALTTLGDRAFLQCESLVSAEIPSGVTAIPDNCFAYCYALSSVTLPDTLTSIGTYAFRKCTALPTIDLPESLTSLGTNVFSECTSLNNVVVPDGIKAIPSNMFYKCTSLDTITIPDSVTSFGSHAFGDCSSFTEFKFPSSLTTIGNSALYGCSGLTEITVPEGVVTIGTGAFQNCTGLVKITFPESVTSYGSSVLSGCDALASFEFPQSMTEIPYDFFRDCDGLRSITIPSHIKTIKHQAFQMCYNLEEVILSEGITTMEYGIFYQCKALREIVVPESVTSFGGSMFSNCESLVSASLPSHLTELPAETFEYCKSLLSAPIPSGVTSIGADAFAYCESLPAIEFPAGVTKMGTGVCMGCKSLTEVTIPDGVTQLLDSSFKECSALTKIDLSKNLTFLGQYVLRDCTVLVSLELPDSLNTISSYSLAGCTSLTSVDIPTGLQKIDWGAFNGCTALEKLVLFDDITSVGSGAFINCPNLTIYAIPGSVIWNYAAENGINVAEMETGSMLTVSVQTPEGESVTGGVTINWYETDSDELTASGRHLSNVDAAVSYDYEIILDEALSYQYYQPARTTAVTDGGVYSFTVALEEIPAVTVTGAIADSEGNAVVGASVVFTQTYNGQYKKTVDGTVTNDTYTAELYAVPSRAFITATGYYDRPVALAELQAGTYDMGTVTMNPLPEKKVTLTLNEISAAQEEQESFITERNNVNNLEFAVSNLTTGEELTQFMVQYPEILFEGDEVSAGDTIEITVTDASGETTVESVRVILDEFCCADATICLTENGSVLVNGILGSTDSYVMIFNADGQFVQSEYAGSGYSSPALPAGDYTFVFIKATTLLCTVPTLDTFASLGLDAGEDYTVKDITIKNGVITVIDTVDVPLFDESVLYYTVGEDTGFTSSKSSIVLGNYITLRAEYRISEEHNISGEQVMIVLPEGVQFTPDSLTVDGEIHTYSYNDNTRTLTVNTNAPAGVLRFYVLGMQSGAQSIPAYLNFNLDGENLRQPIGTAMFTVEEMTVDMPEITGRTSFWMSGTVLPDSVVTLYEGDDVIGTVKANKIGFWETMVDLIKPYSYSIHDITVKIENDNYKVDEENPKNWVIVNTPPLIYDETHVELAQIEMIHMLGGEEKHTFVDFLNPGTIPRYIAQSGKTSFTFKVSLLNGTPENVSNVQVHVTQVTGNQIPVPCTYEEKSGTWVGTWAVGTVYDDGLPEYLNATFDVAENTAVNLAGNMDQMNDLIAAYQDYWANPGIDFGDYLDAEILEDEENHLKLDISAALEDSECFVADVNILDAEQIELSEFDSVRLSDGSVLYSSEYDDGSQYSVTTYRTGEEKAYQLILQAPGFAAEVMPMDAEHPNASAREAWTNFIKDFVPGSSGFQIMTEVFSMQRALGENYRSLIDSCEDIPVLITKKCKNGSYALTESQMQYFEYALHHLKARNDQWYNETKAEIAGYQYFSSSVAALGGLIDMLEFESAAAEAMLSGGFTGFGMLSTHAMWNDIIYDYRDLLIAANDLKTEIMAAWNCDPEKNKTPKGRLLDPSIKIDPSGYVYEAVPSNRMEGVRAAAYYYDADAGEAVFWADAEDYCEINPVFTDSEGRYRWDVPFGQWLVKFTKEGYYDTDSRNDPAAIDGYLPVPPPQTEVNTAIVSKAAPEVESIMVYNDSVRIEFSQYMQPDTVDADTITVVCGGTEIPGTVEPLNLEYDYEEVYHYASIYSFIPETDLSGSATVTIAGAVNYADRAMEKTFRETQKVTYRPESIEVSESIDVAYNSGALLNIQILPAEAGAGRTLTVSSSSPSIATVLQDTVVADENGMATVMVEGLLPGTGAVRIALDGTGLETYVMAEVGDIVKDDSACEKVTADIESGSTVDSGTLLTLTTETEDAEIYYTLDGSCPCEADNPARILYTGPIAITEDMYLIAYAVKDGYTDSPTAGFAYKVRVIAGDVDADGDTDEDDRVILTYYFAGYDGYTEKILNRRAADVDGDGEFTRRDAMLLARRIAEWK